MYNYLFTLKLYNKNDTIYRGDKMRLLTRSDFDGLACGVLFRELGMIDEWKFVHPKDIQDGIVETNENDILANIPYVEGCGMWFDHHSSETERLGNLQGFKGVSKLAPSAAHVVYEYYGGESNPKLLKFKEMIHYVDKVDSGDLTIEEIKEPKGWILLGFIMDPRTGLGRFRDFTISNYELMLKLMEECRIKNIDSILNLPDVLERVRLYYQQDKLFKEMLVKYTTVHKNVILTDLRGVETIYTGNRFLIYSLYPSQNISIWVVDGRAKLNCSIACGYSVINRSSKTDIGSLMYKYGGGGHKQVGTCQVPYDEADDAIKKLIRQMNIDG